MDPITRREFVAAAAVGTAALAAEARPRAPLRLGMLGMWHSHASGVVRQVVEHPDEFTLVGFHDADKTVAADRRKAWEPKVPNFRYFDSPEALLKEPMDGVVVDGQVYENLKFTRMALESGRPVMLEKPAGTNLDEHRKLIALAREKKLHVQMIYLFRYMSAVQEVFARAKKGEFGRIYEFRARLPKDIREYQYFVDQLKPYPGGMFFEMAGHVIDMMVAILGKPKSVKGFLGHHHSEPPASYLDHGVAVFGFEHAWGIIEVPAIESVPHSRRLEVYGTGGAAMIPHLGSGHLANKDLQPIDLCKAGGTWERLDLKAQTLHIRDLREFAAVVSGKKEPEFSMDHDLVVQEALLQACGM